MRGNIGRRRFLGTAAAGIGAAAMGLSGTARGIGGDEPWENKVYPESVRTDRDNIAEAIFHNRVVILMSRTYSEQGRGVLQEFDLRGQDPIEIPHGVTIIGQNAKILSDGTVFTCSKDVKLSIRGVYFSNTKTIPIEVTDAGGTPGVNISQLAIGGDEPWENPVPPA